MLSTNTTMTRLTSLKPEVNAVAQDWPQRRTAILEQILASEETPSTASRAAWPGRRLLLGAAAATAVAIAVPLVSPDTTPMGPSRASAEAIEVLARTAAATPLDTVPAGLYRHIVTRQIAHFDQGPSQTSTVETWSSVQGQLWRRSETRHSDGRLTQQPLQSLGTPEGDTFSPTPRFVRRMPSQPQALESWLRARVTGSSTQEEAVFVAVEAILETGYAAPDQRAAALRVLSGMRRVSVSHGRTDGLGRSAIVIAYEGRSDVSEEMLIDPATAQLLEEQKTFRYDTPVMPETQRATGYTTTVLSTGIVASLPSH